MSETLAEIAAPAENAEQANASMEKLQLDDEEETNDVSAEDFLGGKSLLMSDSEDETINKISPKNRKKRLLDSDEEPEQVEVRAQTVTITAEQIPSEEATEEIAPIKTKKKISAIIDTDSEEEQNAEDLVSVQDTPQKEKKVVQTKALRLQSDESDQEESASDAEKGVTHSKLKGLVDSDSEQSTAEDAADEIETPIDQGHVQQAKKDKPMRVSAKKAMDEMQTIQSEQQRLHREAHISVPYHQPKPRTLQEFLSRRTINRPLATALAGGSPMPVKQPRQSIGLRMNSEELAAYAKLMEERAQEAAEFFKSDSDDEQSDNDESMELKDNPGVMDVMPNAAQELHEAEDQAQQLEENEIEENPAELAIDNDQMDEPLETVSAEVDTEMQQDKEISSPKSNVLVTEVVELPRLDLSTLSITPPSKPATPRISEAIRRLRTEKRSDVSPSLKGDANMVIDLETGDMFAKEPSGVDDLLQRLIKTREAKKHKTTETVNILSTEHGKLEVNKVSIHLHDEEPVNKEQKPGAAYIKMREQLKSLIKQKRLEELRKRQTEEMAADMEDDEYMDIDEEYEPEEKPDKVKFDDENRPELTINDEEEIVAAEADEVGQDESNVADEEAENASSESEEESESGQEQQTQTNKRKNRIIRAFQDDNSDEDDVDLLQTPKPTDVAPITATQLQVSAHKLFDAEVQRTASDEENELLDLCSGKFTPTQKPASEAGAIISQMPVTQARTENDMSEELEALCSGSFATQQKQQLSPAKPQRILSSEEEPAEVELAAKPRNKKLTKKRQKQKAKLGFSDDEESADEDDGNGQEVDSAEENGDMDDLDEAAADAPETFVDYDSEENEVLVEMTKKDRKLRAANFVDKEAELSESEWGSADEDEQNMDNYDIELGDEDQFDREKLRRELEQIHARKMLDQDIREVRQIKEMLFEDDEGAVRQRQFRWKNAESGFNLEERNENGGADPNEGSGDEENELLWRKIRYEREQLLLEKGLKGAENSSALPLSPAVVNTSKLHIITAKKSTVELKKSSPFLISKNVTTSMQQQKTARGSFLVRDKATLSKLAGLTKGSAGDVDGAAGTVSIKTVKAKNFVFATLTEEEHEHQKRKAADLLNSSSETGINFIKKPRLEPRRDKCLIDQLL